MSVKDQAREWLFWYRRGRAASAEAETKVSAGDLVEDLLSANKRLEEEIYFPQQRRVPRLETRIMELTGSMERP